MILDCHAGGCTLTVHTPYKFVPTSLSGGIPTKKSFKRSTKIEIARDQLVRAENIKWDPKSKVIVENYGINAPPNASGIQNEGEGDDYERRPKKPRDKRKYKQKYPKYKKKSENWNSGPDANGNYDSYVLVLRDSLSLVENEAENDPNESPSQGMDRRMAAQRLSAMNDPNSLSSLLAPFIINDKSTNADISSSMEFIIHPRVFNLGQTRRLARTSVAQINAWTKRRRAHCIVRESRPVAWQGLVLLILGIFSFVLCLLIGQFWEEYDPTKVGSYKKRMVEMRKRDEVKKMRQATAARRTRPTSNGNTPWAGTKRRE